MILYINKGSGKSERVLQSGSVDCAVVWVLGSDKQKKKILLWNKQLGTRILTYVLLLFLWYVDVIFLRKTLEYTDLSSRSQVPP